MGKKEETHLQSCLTELNLTTARRQYPELAEKAESESLSYQEFLLSVLEAECHARRIRRIERGLRESRLPLEKNFETFDLTRLPQKVNRQIKTLRQGDFLTHNENVLIFGNPGSGNYAKHFVM